MVEGLVVLKDMAFNESDRAAIYRAISARRDVRRGFVDRPLPVELLRRLLAAAHSAPSVGLMQPSRFIVIHDLAIRTAVHDLFEEANRKAAATQQGDRGERYAALKLESILEAPQNLALSATLRINLDPLWTILDLTPRGATWYPKLEYPSLTSIK
jgi:5,6-dimethylbenzimidazole synthase